MTWKEFQKWCSDRTFDGCWGYHEAKMCLEVISAIKSVRPWRRKAAWKRVEQDVVRLIVEPTNELIKRRSACGR